MSDDSLSAWVSLIKSSRWRKHAHSTALDRARCAMCRRDFAPGPEGPPTFTEERGAMLIRICPDCEPFLTTIR